MFTNNAARLEGTKQAILERLMPGERHVLSIAHELRIRESAIRRHFDQLERAGFVEGFFRQEGLGRPKKYYALTEQGRDRFPRAYAEPLARELRTLVDEGEASDLEAAVLVVARHRVDRHQDRLQAARTSLAKARALERILNELGLAARARPHEDTIQVEWTSSAVLREALGGRDQLSSDWLGRVLQTVLEQMEASGLPRLQAGQSGEVFATPHASGSEMNAS